MSTTTEKRAPSSGGLEDTPASRWIQWIPEWIDDEVTLGQVQSIAQDRCASGAYMPAVETWTALETLRDKGEAVLDYCMDYGILEGHALDERLESEGWGGLACWIMSRAVECWAQIALDELDQRSGEPFEECATGGWLDVGHRVRLACDPTVIGTVEDEDAAGELGCDDFRVRVSWDEYADDLRAPWELERLDEIEPPAELEVWRDLLCQLWIVDREGGIALLPAQDGVVSAPDLESRLKSWRRDGTYPEESGHRYMAANRFVLGDARHVATWQAVDRTVKGGQWTYDRTRRQG